VAGSLAIDSTGNVLYAGGAAGTVDFGTGPLAADLTDGGGGTDIVFAKFTP
jgi:hypothetical protein